MTQESDRVLYIHLTNLSRNRPLYYLEFHSLYRRYLEDIESRYDEDTLRKWTDKMG